MKTIAKWQGHQDGGKLIMDTYTEAFGADQREFEKKQLMKLTKSERTPRARSCPATRN
jgi:hypothetical protein